MNASQPESTPADSAVSHRQVSILFADVRGFSSIAATYPPALVLELLHEAFSKMSEIIARHGGMIDKFMGDSVMAVFAGEGDAQPEAAKRAVLCAVEMQVAMDELNREHRKLSWPEMHLGIGINSGKVVSGQLGSPPHAACTIIGEEVNLASRIEAFSLRGQVLISQATFELCGDSVVAGEPMEVYLKGKEEPVRLREVLAVPSCGKELPRQEGRRSPRVEVKMPFSYRLVENRMVRAKADTGAILDLGYHGFLGELDRELGLHSEIALDLELPLVGYRASDIYARIVKLKQDGNRILAGVEFTSLSAESHRNIRLLVQMLMQGTEIKQRRSPARYLKHLAAKTASKETGAKAWRITGRLTLLVLLTFSVLQYYFLNVLAEILSLPGLTFFTIPLKLGLG